MTTTSTAPLTRAEALALTEDYARTVQEHVNRLHAEVGYDVQVIISIEPGRRFARVVYEDSRSLSRHVHAFVDLRTGDVLKAAGWKAPQKDRDGLAVRFSLADPDDRARCYAAIDPWGSYLYKR